jgi:hypothetical protein
MRRWDALAGPLEQRAGRVVRQDDGADIGEALLEVEVLEDARTDTLAALARTQRGPAVVSLREGAGR